MKKFVMIAVLSATSALFGAENPTTTGKPDAPLLYVTNNDKMIYEQIQLSLSMHNNKLSHNHQLNYRVVEGEVFFKGPYEANLDKQIIKSDIMSLPNVKNVFFEN